MKSLLHIGNDNNNNKVTIKAITEALVQILETGAKNHTEQLTIRAAIKVISDITEVNGVTVNNSTFTNNPTEEEA